MLRRCGRGVQWAQRWVRSAEQRSGARQREAARGGGSSAVPVVLRPSASSRRSVAMGAEGRDGTARWCDGDAMARLGRDGGDSQWSAQGQLDGSGACDDDGRNSPGWSGGVAVSGRRAGDGEKKKRITRPQCRTLIP
ncbi:hypothetical protein U1Q18_041322 [Sarracenia purpurea var. burkii]